MSFVIITIIVIAFIFIAVLLIWRFWPTLTANTSQQVSTNQTDTNSDTLQPEEDDVTHWKDVSYPTIISPPKSYKPRVLGMMCDEQYYCDKQLQCMNNVCQYNIDELSLSSKNQMCIIDDQCRSNICQQIPYLYLRLNHNWHPYQMTDFNINRMKIDSYYKDNIVWAVADNLLYCLQDKYWSNTYIGDNELLPNVLALDNTRRPYIGINTSLYIVETDYSGAGHLIPYNNGIQYDSNQSMLYPTFIDISRHNDILLVSNNTIYYKKNRDVRYNQLHTGSFPHFTSVKTNYVSYVYVNSDNNIVYRNIYNEEEYAIETQLTQIIDMTYHKESLYLIGYVNDEYHIYTIIDNKLFVVNGYVNEDSRLTNNKHATILYNKKSCK